MFLPHPIIFLLFLILYIQTDAKTYTEFHQMAKMSKNQLYSTWWMINTAFETALEECKYYIERGHILLWG